MLEDQDVPVLNSVVKAGNESIIESTRLGREVLLELEAMKAMSPAHADPEPQEADSEALDTAPQTVNEHPAPAFQAPMDTEERHDEEADQPLIGDGSAVHLKAEIPVYDAVEATSPEPISETEPEPMSDADTEELLEQLIDDLVDRHVSALREDLRRLLLTAQNV